jgi:hypothetical protein
VVPIIGLSEAKTQKDRFPFHFWPAGHDIFKIALNDGLRRSMIKGSLGCSVSSFISIESEN